MSAPVAPAHAPLPLRCGLHRLPGRGVPRAHRRRAPQSRPRLGRLRLRARPSAGRCSIINDAAMQALGSYRGGRMLFLGLGTGLGVDPDHRRGGRADRARPHALQARRAPSRTIVGERGRKRARQQEVAQERHRDRRASEGGARGRLRGARRRQCRAPQEPAARRAAAATTATPSSAACACGSAARCTLCCPPRGARRGATDGQRAGCSRTCADLVQQRQGDGRLLARFLAPVVHHRRRHHQRGLLPARRPAADPRPRLHRRRRRRLLGGGQAAVAAQRAAGRARRARRCTSCTSTSASSSALRVDALRAPRRAADRGGPRAAMPRCAPTRCSHRIWAAPVPTISPGCSTIAAGACCAAEQGPLRAGAARGGRASSGRLGPRQRRLRRQQRRLAGFRPQRRASPGSTTRPGRATSRSRASCRARRCWRSASAAAPSRPRRWRAPR